MATNRHRHFRFSCFSSSDEAGSSQRDDLDASSSNQTQPALREIIQKKDIAKVEGRFVVDTPKLMQHISELLELREKGKLRQEQSSKPNRSFEWSSVPWFDKLKEIVSFGTDFKKLALDLLKPGFDLVSALKDIISGPVKILLTDIGKASLATAGLLLVAYTLEGFDNLSSNQDECWLILEQMRSVANAVEILTASPELIQDLIEPATILIAEGAIMCCSNMDSSPWKEFFLSQKIKQDLSDIRNRLSGMYMQINVEISVAIFTAVLSTYPRHPVGIEKPIEQVFSHLEIQSDDQNAVTVILHGFGGMGKTTLADAVFSEIGGEGMVKSTVKDADFWKTRGGKRSKVRLFDGIKSTPDITALQKQILEDLMEPGEIIPEISTHQDGQRELERVLRKVHAFIYIDNVLEAAALEELLPQDMTTAKKVRLLLTARDENVKNACPRSRTEPKVYDMQKIHDPEAMVILKREIEEGVTETQFSDIIQICGGIPLMLTLAAAFIRRADNKEEAYATLMEQKDKWASEDFKEMRYAFAYDALPQPCKDPFQDICTYFNGWNWDIVKDIVGDDALMMLKSRALVTRTTNGFASVHDVILTLAHGMSKEESKDKEVRCKFTNASELKKFLEEGDTEGITGIWLTERKEDGDDRKEVVVQASALDKMQKSLRVLQLGNSVKVEGNCNEIFKELCFFKANISRLPFTVSQLTQLRYLSYDPPNWVPSSLPSSLAIMNFNGKAFQTYK